MPPGPWLLCVADPSGPICELPNTSDEQDECCCCGWLPAVLFNMAARASCFARTFRRYCNYTGTKSQALELQKNGQCCASDRTGDPELINARIFRKTGLIFTRSPHPTYSMIIRYGCRMVQQPSSETTFG